jgi:hypothetical protein
MYVVHFMMKVVVKLCKCSTQLMYIQDYGNLNKGWLLRVEGKLLKIWQKMCPISVSKKKKERAKFPQFVINDSKSSKRI